MADKEPLPNDLGNLLQTTESSLGNILYTSDSDPTSSTGYLPSVVQKPNFEGITLIWYDPRINETEDIKLTSEQLREINDCVILYSEHIACINYIRSVVNEKIFLITSGKAAASVLPEIYRFKQIDSIFIFCLKVEKYQCLLEKYDAIVGIYSERSSLIDAITQNVDLLQKQLNTFCFYNEHEEKTTRNISKESAEFLWFQLFKDVLLQMPRSDQAKQQLIDFCRHYYRGNKKEYNNITEFTKSYKLEKSIYWYTKDSFLYRLVNKALRTEDIGQLHIFRFFISDLSSQLAEIHMKENYGQTTTVMLYRGLHLEIDELNRLKQNTGSIISANGFLSTSRSKNVAIRYASKTTKRKNVVRVLFEIECNLHTTKSVIFANITKYSVFSLEQETLFDLGSTFKIDSIIDDEITLVKLIATDDGMKMAQKYIKLNRKMNEEMTPNTLFGILLIQMGKYDQSLSYFGNLLNESNGKTDTARIYSEIGFAYLCQGELDKALDNADRAYQMMIKMKRSRIKDSFRPVTVMAHVYLRREMYEKALDLYFEALEIEEKFSGPNHLDTAVALNHIGNVYYKMENYSESLEFYQRALEIYKIQLPDVHLDRASSLNNMGLIQWKMNKVDIAQIYYEKSLRIRKQLLPSGHNDIMQSLYNIARIFYDQDRIDESLKHFTEALTAQKIDFDPNDRQNLLSRLGEKFGSKKIFGTRMYAMKNLRQWPEYSIKEPDRDRTHVSLVKQSEQCHMCLTDWVYPIELERQDLERRKLKEQEDRSILENFIKTLKNDDNYSMTLELVKTILKLNAETSWCEHCYPKHLIEYLHNLIRDAYDSSDESITALHFYDKVKFILENQISYTVYTENIQGECFKRIQWKIEKDRSILENFINILKNDGDHSMVLGAVKKVLMESSQIFISGYNHTEHLMGYLRYWILGAYNSTDDSIEAFRFYKTVQSLIESTIPHLAVTNDVQIICLERIGYIHQINGNYESAVESLEECVKIQRNRVTDREPRIVWQLPYQQNSNCSTLAPRLIEETVFQEAAQRKTVTPAPTILVNPRHWRSSNKSLEVISDKLRCIGLIHMTLGNYKSALKSFNDALELLEENSAQNDREEFFVKNDREENSAKKKREENAAKNEREKNILLKRIEQATEALKSNTDSPK